MPIALVVHGGAGTVTDDRITAVQAGCKEAVWVGWHILQAGGSALEAVEAATRKLEDNPQYNAGTGSCLSADGNIEMDAGIMEGYTMQVGAVAGVERIKNPIALARKVLDSPHTLLIGKGAQQFAVEQGITLCRLEDLVTSRQYSRWKEAQKEQPTEEKHGTVGAVALDSRGNLAAATSTGGIPNKYPGRVGDSPLVGCGFYADETAAVSCTGDGEDFTRLLLARRAVELVQSGLDAAEAAQTAILFLQTRASGTGGLILVDYRGNVGIAKNSQHMAQAYINHNMQEPRVAV